jgi:hypothetical protein
VALGDKRLAKLGKPPRVNFIIILLEASVRADPESAKKRQSYCQSFFALLESVCAEAAQRVLMKLAPGTSGECRGITIKVLHLKAIWTTGWRKNNKNNKDSQTGQITHNFLKRNKILYSLSFRIFHSLIDGF